MTDKNISGINGPETIAKGNKIINIELIFTRFIFEII
tara:strand:+ start:611 stop:721 length:111 start_codon:yes stop_codon:yes gene_type:complete